MDWAAFEAWVAETLPGNPGFAPWIPLLRDGRLSAKLKALWVDEDGAEHVEDHPAELQYRKVEIPIDFDDIRRKALRAELKGLFEAIPCVGSRDAAREAVRGKPAGTRAVYDPKRGSWASLLLALQNFVGRPPTSPVKVPTKAEARGAAYPAEAPAAAPALLDPEPAGWKPLAPSEDLWKPPPAAVQHARCAHTHPSLMKYLKSSDVLARAGMDQWKAIRAWMRCDEGRIELRKAGLDPEGVQLDHVIPNNIGGLNSVYNAHFLPSSVNAHFGDNYNAEKKAYVGRYAWRHAEAFARWHRDLVQLSPAGPCVRLYDPGQVYG